MLTCSGYWKYIHVFFVDDISQKLLFTHFIWSMLCEVLEFAVEVVVSDITVTYNLETWKPYYASSHGVINMKFCMRWIHNGERLCLKTICVLYQQMARYCKEQRFKVFCTRVGTLIVATIYLQLIQNRYMFRSFTVLQCSHQHCVQPVASDVEVVGYL